MKPLVNAGYCVASIDYRLAPETKLPQIIEDLEDAFRWLRMNGREKLRVDPSKIAVLGACAGGYLTLTGVPRPAAAHGAGLFLGLWRSGGAVGVETQSA